MLGTIVGEARFEHPEDEIARKSDDSGWRYPIEALAYYTPPDEPDVDVLLAGLSDHRDELEVLDVTYFDWIFRITPFVGTTGAGQAALGPRQRADAGRWFLPGRRR